MTRIALIFPGQGTQTVGMARELYETFNVARGIIDKADELTANGLKDVMFNGPQEKLTETAYSQPAIFSHSMAALEVLKASDKYKDLEPVACAGLSLGEYAALCASGALGFDETLALLRKRAEYMGEATRLHKGRMAAIIGLDKEKLNEICQQTGAEVANYNSLQQTVITGHAQRVEEAAQKCGAAGARNVVMLDVAGAFHSTLMQTAADKCRSVLEDITLGTPTIPLVSNVDAAATTDPQKIKENLAKQITSSVQWVNTIQHIASNGITDFIEIGPGKVLRGLLRKIDPGLNVHNIGKPADMEKLAL